MLEKMRRYIDRMDIPAWVRALWWWARLVLRLHRHCGLQERHRSGESLDVG